VHSPDDAPYREHTEAAATSNSADAGDVGAVVLYDGDCGLCDGFVKWIVPRDRHARFHFAPLQGETAKRLIGTPTGPATGWTVMLVDADGQIFERSEAALRIMTGCGGIWRLAGILRIVPRGLRDLIYRWIARNRRRWFGGAEACTLPSPAVRARLLP